MSDKAMEELKQPRKLGKFDSLSLVLRFWSKVNKHGPIPQHKPELGPCWLWTGAMDGKDYGHIWANGKLQPSHRIAWEMAHGPIPDGLQPDHLCRNHACVNVAHLELVTSKENTLRGDGPTARRANQTHSKH